MSGVVLQAELQDLVVEDYLKKLGSGDFDRADLMDEVANIIERSTVERFRSNIAPDGQKWLPSERVMRAQEPASTLVDSGHLRDSITSQSDGDSAEVGSNEHYALIHQEGGQTGRNHATKLPARPYLGLSRGDKIDVEGAVIAYLEGM